MADEQGRMGEFKNMDGDAGRKRREEQRVTLRERNRELMLQKKRIGLGDGQQVVIGQNDTPSTSPHHREQAEYLNSHISKLEQYKAEIFSDDMGAQTKATQVIRKLLSIEKNPPINEVIMAGMVPRFITFLQLEGKQYHELQFESAWALTNIASGNADHTRFVVENGGIQIFSNLLSSTEILIQEQAVWALGNIAGDCADLRNAVLESGALSPLLTILGNSNKVSMMRNSTWALSNLCRGKPIPKLEMICPALPVLAHLLWHEDSEVRTDACWAVSYISDGPNDRIDAVLAANILPRLVTLLTGSNPNAHTPALRTIGNIVTGDDNQTQCVIDSGALAHLPPLFSASKKSIRKETCWAVSNIAAGSPKQIEALIQNGCIPPLVGMLSNNDFDVKREAVWALSNATTGGVREQTAYLVQQCNCIPPLCELLSAPDLKMIRVTLEALHNILRTGEDLKEGNNGRNPWAQIVIDHRGLDKIESLQTSNDEEVYQQSAAILELFFDVEEVDGTEAGGLGFTSNDNNGQPFKF